ncbi:MAG: polyhydroxyalkanoic acid system family protein [Betaproteobacteria bacterium]|nr:polyhydroxyalkanoic acid system family protein [Betaproteobacteria bacterium]
MSDIFVRRAHAMSPKRARTAAERVAVELGEEFALQHRWEDAVLKFWRSGVNGELKLDGHEVEIRVRLGFLLAVMRPRIEEEIHRYLDENFGRPGKARA